ncbi:MAG: hypothetical protein J0I99_00760 [Devosia sp.]|uniref:hypothetical protein n=1 Tax=Devosia sp. TaxID=1871048 RepID=UPI001AC7A26D|nr:hypothetical protein [Devosia sp.]MBN9308799.1 hypothetical protein [Devosia sp.]MBN9314248.1 hypothetical protein [Devosia sp.]
MSNTAHRSYPKPVPTNNVSDDVALLQQAMDLVDGDINLLFAAVAGLAPVAHEHVIANIQGLSAALDGKAAVGHTHTLDDLSDVAGAGLAPAGYLLVKQVDGSWGPASPASIVGAHQHVIDDVQNLQTALDGLASAAQINAATEVAFDPADYVGGRRSSDGSFIKSTWSTLRAAVVVAFGANLANRTPKSTPIDADLLGIADSAATNATKKVTFLEAWTNYFKVKADALYQGVSAKLLAFHNLANAAGYLKNDGAGGYSWAVPTSIAHIKETSFVANGTFTPDPDAVVTQIVAVGWGVGAATGSGGSGGKAGTVITVSGSKAEIGNAGITVNMGTQSNSNNVDGTSTSFGNMVTIQSLRRASASYPAANTNLPDATVITGAANGSFHGHPSLNTDRFGFAGPSGNNSNANQSGNSGGPGGPSVILVREYLST